MQPKRVCKKCERALLGAEGLVPIQAIIRPVLLLCWLRFQLCQAMSPALYVAGNRCYPGRFQFFIALCGTPACLFTVLHPVLLEYVCRRSSFVCELPDSLSNKVIQKSVNL